MLPEELRNLCNLVVAVAERELPHRFSGYRGKRKSDGSLVTEADLVMQQALASALQSRWPDIAMLGEEMDAEARNDALRQGGGEFWCVDPLDGTSNFAAGIPYFAVSVALVRNGRPCLGVVYDPNRKEVFCAAQGRGAWLNDARLAADGHTARLDESVALIDLKRLPRALATRLASAPPYRSQRSFGSVALEWCWLAAGRGHLYLHGRQNLWDYAAGYLVLMESGGRALTLDGEAVFTPTLAPRSAAAALDASLFEPWRAWLEIPAGG